MQTVTCNVTPSLIPRLALCQVLFVTAVFVALGTLATASTGLVSCSGLHSLQIQG
jgi:hypothetical protein